MSAPCSFKVGDRIRELGPVLHAFGESEQLDSGRPVATVTAITERGFEYTYETPVSIGRAAWGQLQTGGECYPEGYWTWRKVIP